MNGYVSQLFFIVSFLAFTITQVCKSLYLEDEFIELAYQYRNKYYPENQATLVRDTTQYNAKKIKGMCEFAMKK